MKCGAASIITGGKETLLPSKSPVSAASSHGTARLVSALWRVWGLGVTKETQRFWDEFCVKGRHCDEILFDLGHLN